MSKKKENESEEVNQIEENTEVQNTAVESEAEAEKEEDYSPTKKVVRRRKSKKEKENPLSAAIRLAVESGKVDFGSNIGMKNVSENKAKLFVVANNVPELSEQVKASKTSVPVIEYEGSSVELGSICGKPFPVSLLSVYDAGSSNILEMTKKKK